MGFSYMGLFAQRWIGDKLWRLFFVGDSEECEVAQAYDLRHLDEIDLVDCVGDMVIVRVKAGKKPERRDVMQDEGELVGSEENAESGIPLEAIVECETDVLVFALD